MPLRILLIAENAGAGTGRHVVDLAQGLLAAGAMVSLLYSPLRREAWFEDAVANISGLVKHEVAMTRAPGLHDLSSLASIRRIVARHGPYDVIHGHSSKGGALARVAGIGTKSVRVYTPHALITLDGSLSRFARFVYTVAERLLARLGDGIICVSREEQEHALAIGLPAPTLFVVNNGIRPLVEANRTHARQRLGLAENDVCIGFVGRIAPQKNLRHLLVAFARILPDLRDLRLAIVGEGPQLQEFRELAQHLQIDNRIVWAGQADGPALMAGFDLFALPSRYEAFPYVLIEAAYRGLPIVTTNIGGASAIVESGRNGVVVEQDDVGGFATSLLRISRNAELRRTMGEASVETAQRFSVDRMVEETRGVYECLLNRGGTVEL